MADQAAESGRCITITLKHNSGVIHSKRRSEGIFVFVFRFNSYLEKCITQVNLGSVFGLSYAIQHRVLVRNWEYVWDSVCVSLPKVCNKPSFVSTRLRRT